MCSLLNMNAVTALVLALAVGLVHCEIQQDLSKEPDAKRKAKPKPTNRVISKYWQNAVAIPSRNPKSNLDRSYFPRREHTSDEEYSSEISKEDIDNREEGSVKYEGNGRPHFSWDMEGSGNEYGSGEFDDSRDDYVGKEDYGDSIDLFTDADIEEFIQNAKRKAKPKPTNRVISKYWQNAVAIPSIIPKSNLDRSYFHRREHTSDEEDNSEISEEDDDNREEGSSKYEGSGRPHFNWDMEGSGNEYGSEEYDGSGDDYVEQEDYGDSIDFFTNADLQEFIQNEELFFPESLLIDPDKITDKTDDYNSLEASKEDDENGLEGSKEGDIKTVDKPKATNQVISKYDLVNVGVIPNRSPKNNLDRSYSHIREHTSDEVDNSELSKEEYDDYDDREEGSTKYEGSGRHHINWDMEGSGNEYGSREFDHSENNYVEQEHYVDRLDLLADADLEEDNSELSKEDDYDNYDNIEEGTTKYEGNGRPHFNWDMEGSGNEYGSGEFDHSENNYVEQEDYGDRLDFLADADLEENNSELSKEDDYDNYDDREEGTTKYEGSGRPHFNWDMEGSGNEYESGEVDHSEINYVGKEDYGNRLDFLADTNLEEFRRNEDLFFPESLLVDPDEDTDTSYGYNSLEAPKEDSKSVLETPEEVDKNELKGSKDEDLNRIAGTKPPNRMISIYDLANAVVIPSKSTKNNFDRSYFHSSEHRSDEENSSETSEEENSSETSEEDDDDSEEGSATYEGSGSPHFKWDMEGSGDEYGSGEVDSSGDFNVGQEDYENSIDLLAEADLEEFIPIKTGNLSADIDSQIDVEYEEEDDISIYSPPKNNLVIHGYKGSPIGEMAKIDFLENEMYQVKGQISQLSARMEQQSNDISHLQQIILQLQEQINMLIYRQYLPRD